MSSRTTLLTLALALTFHAGAIADPLPYTGVNLAGGEFYKPKPGVRPVYGKNFTYPTKAEIDDFAGAGMNIFRYPFLWETLQPKAREPLDPAEVERLKTSVRLATAQARRHSRPAQLRPLLR